MSKDIIQGFVPPEKCDSDTDRRVTVEGRYKNEEEDIVWKLKYLPENDLDPEITKRLIEKIAPWLRELKNATVFLQESNLTALGLDKEHFQLDIRIGDGGDQGLSFVYCDTYTCPDDDSTRPDEDSNPEDVKGMVVSEVFLPPDSKKEEYLGVASGMNKIYWEVLEEVLKEQGKNDVRSGAFTAYMSGGAFLGD